MIRDLPRGTALLDELTRALGREARGVVLAEGDWPASIVAFGDRHLLLVRDYAAAAQLSMPADQSWTIATRRELEAAMPAIVAAIAAWRTKPARIGLADAVAAVLRCAQSVKNARFRVDFPAGGIPLDATLEHQWDRITLAQKGAAIEVRVFVRDDWRTERVEVPEELAALTKWLERGLVDHARATQKRLAEEAAATARRKKAGDEMFGDVVDALRAGHRVWRGGGRWNVTFFFEEGTFRRTTFDEGHEQTDDISEAALRAAVEDDPEAFRSVYGSAAGGKKTT